MCRSGPSRESWTEPSQHDRRDSRIESARRAWRCASGALPRRVPLEPPLGGPVSRSAGFSTPALGADYRGWQGVGVPAQLCRRIRPPPRGRNARRGEWIPPGVRCRDRPPDRGDPACREGPWALWSTPDCSRHSTRRTSAICGGGCGAVTRCRSWSTSARALSNGAAPAGRPCPGSSSASPDSRCAPRPCQSLSRDRDGVGAARGRLRPNAHERCMASVVQTVESGGARPPRNRLPRGGDAGA
jgi:hypothetical protein